VIEESATRRALRFLLANGPQPATMVGSHVWYGRLPHRKTTSMGGGGDYAAQMLLGKLKKRGLVRHAESKGSSKWEITWEGRKWIG